MRAAILGDIHGNPLALDAVINDIGEQGGADAYWLMGDFAALGYDQEGVLERDAALPGAIFLRGNTDRDTAAFELSGPFLEAAQADPALIPKLVEVSQSFAWTSGYVTGHGWLGWLADLPLDHRLTLPDGTRVLLVHAAPGRDSGPGVRPNMPPDELRAAVAGCEADLVVVGHTHWPQDHTVDGVRVINPGSVSNSPAADIRPSYALLEADEHGWRLDFRRVAYDVAAAIDALKQARHPAEAYLLAFLEGRFLPPWWSDDIRQPGA